MARVRLAVIGMSGQGKSTLLNALADDGSDVPKNYFTVSNSPDGCTSRVKEVTINSHVNGRHFDLTIIDTMGFPDPNPEKAAEYYDQVVTACNGELNAIIWVQKDNRVNAKEWRTMKILMGEFNKARPPIYLLINGTQSYTLRDRKAPSFAAIIPSCCKDDLFGSAKEKIFGHLTCTSPVKSSMKTFQQLIRELHIWKSQAAREASVLAKMNEEKVKAEKKVSLLQERKNMLENPTKALVAAAPVLYLIPFAGFFAAAADTMLSGSLTADIAKVEFDLRDAMRARRAAVESLQQESSRKRKACEEVEKAKKACDDLASEFVSKKMKTQ